MSKNKKLEKSIKDKLKTNGVSESWMKDHLIVDGLEDEDDECPFCGPKENCNGYKCWIR
tara:strand:- start:5145 stop:5321 length:177 start_codon:yes stop_codon:yes gene_type:complete